MFSYMMSYIKVDNFNVEVIVKPKTADKIPSGEIIHLSFVSTIFNNDGSKKDTINCEAIQKDDKSDQKEKKKSYFSTIDIPDDFEEIGAVIVKLADNSSERFIHTVSVKNSKSGSKVTFSCKSWVQPSKLVNQDRVFFSANKSYIWANTPNGLKALRAKDLQNLKGKMENGSEDLSERKAYERIYAYDVYNDLGDGDGTQWNRPVLGGKIPYPRRSRTGRSLKSNNKYEQRSGDKFYVPRDEEFSEVKEHYFPSSDPENKDLLGQDSFVSIDEIESMFGGGIETPTAPHKILQFNTQHIVCPDQPPPAPLSLEYSSDDQDDDQSSTLLQFPMTELVIRDKYSWLSDAEFARQTLAGVNPYSIQLVKELPFESKLNDDKTYGPRTSLFTVEKVQDLIASYCISVDEAIANKRLFVLDYHDTLMEYVSKVRQINGTTLYASRTLFFLKEDETLIPLGIELSRPPMDGTESWRQLFLPDTDPTNLWLWRLAKAHVLSHDSCIHQLIIHWLRAHCCMEPYVIATNRQLSTVHPIYRLLHPHFRYNMRINANAREGLINAGGIIESTFSTASYSMELSAKVYDKEWRFDQQALPEDLIRRGMAERKKGEPGGVELAIKDYPFASDGLILWDAILAWVTAYVNHYYENDVAVSKDDELKWWWIDITKKGHPDKKVGWPELQTKKDLINIVSTIAWVGSGHHSAINFIQYAYAGYTPNRPSIARTNMPTEDFEELPDDFINLPVNKLLQVFPSVAQASAVTQTMILLSAHSPDEEYIGKAIEQAWTLDTTINKAFKEFQVRLNKLEDEIEKRNMDKGLKNRRGAGVMPYDVFKPTSEPGITGRGVPYSVST